MKTGIQELKQQLGRELAILAHHYQRDEIVELGDVRGDSFALSKAAAANDRARYIVFCGVHFMAESAALLARPEQAVFIPELSAGCPMADMAPIEKVERAWRELGRLLDLDRLVPVTYVNSSAAVKAFCGGRGGATCTSSNADQVFEWALKDDRKILFLPDQHLGTNTAAKLGAGPLAVWDPDEERGGLSEEELKSARVIVWKGFCHVHTAFTVEQIEERRREHPGCQVVVHPECRREVVAAADASGSTEGIIRFTAEQSAGAVIVVGTEIHLVERLAREHGAEKTVLPLEVSYCPNMYKINLVNLGRVLEGIVRGRDHWINQVTVSDEIKRDGALALERMLEIAGARK